MSIHNKSWGFKNEIAYANFSVDITNQKRHVKFKALLFFKKSTWLIRLKMNMAFTAT